MNLDTQVDMYGLDPKRRSSGTEADIISDLPRDVIYRIMKHLPLMDAGRTCILSHKWQDIWTSTPYLEFEAHFLRSVLKEDVHDTHKFCTIVSKILFEHEGPIFKFSMFVPPLDTYPDIAPWISYLSRNGLRDFRLWNMNNTPLRLSSRLFSCAGLENLKLNYCILSPPAKVRGFTKLISLELDSVIIGFRTFKDLMGSFQNLQKLVLINCTGDGMEHMHIVIDAPNLRTLILDWTFKSLELKSCGNLVAASFGMEKFENVRSKASLRCLVKVLANLSKLERLCLRGYFCRVLFNECSIHSTFEKLRVLEMPCFHLDDLFDFSSVISCIQSFPNIETLNISVDTSNNLVEHLLDYNPECRLNHLRCAKVGICDGYSSELKLIEFLLACSPVLEKLLVDTLPVRSPPSRILMQLNQFHRLSPKVEVICPECVVVDSVQAATFADSLDSSSSEDTSSSSEDTSSSDSSD